MQSFQLLGNDDGRSLRGIRLFARSCQRSCAEKPPLGRPNGGFSRRPYPTTRTQIRLPSKTTANSRIGSASPTRKYTACVPTSATASRCGPIAPSASKSTDRAMIYSSPTPRLRACQQVCRDLAWCGVPNAIAVGRTDKNSLIAGLDQHHICSGVCSPQTSCRSTEQQAQCASLRRA